MPLVNTFKTILVVCFLGISLSGCESNPPEVSKAPVIGNDQVHRRVVEMMPETSPETSRLHKFDKSGTKLEVEINFRDGTRGLVRLDRLGGQVLEYTVSRDLDNLPVLKEVFEPSTGRILRSTEYHSNGKLLRSYNVDSANNISFDEYDETGVHILKLRGKTDAQGKYLQFTEWNMQTGKVVSEGSRLPDGTVNLESFDEDGTASFKVSRNPDGSGFYRNYPSKNWYSSDYDYLVKVQKPGSQMSTVYYNPDGSNRKIEELLDMDRVRSVSFDESGRKTLVRYFHRVPTGVNDGTEQWLIAKAEVFDTEQKLEKIHVYDGNDKPVLRQSQVRQEDGTFRTFERPSALDSGDVNELSALDAEVQEAFLADYNENADMDLGMAELLSSTIDDKFASMRDLVSSKLPDNLKLQN